MEVFQTEKFYIFVKQEKSLWWNRKTSEFTLKSGKFQQTFSGLQIIQFLGKKVTLFCFVVFLFWQFQVYFVWVHQNSSTHSYFERVKLDYISFRRMGFIFRWWHRMYRSVCWNYWNYFIARRIRSPFDCNQRVNSGRRIISAQFGLQN